MTNPLPKILPCFYCDNKEIEFDQTFNSPSNHWIVCRRCGYVSSHQFNSRSSVIEAHNHIYKCIDEAFLRIARKEDYWKRNGCGETKDEPKAEE